MENESTEWIQSFSHAYMVSFKPSNTVAQTISYRQQGCTGKGTYPSAQILTVPGRHGLEKAKPTAKSPGKVSCY